MTDLSLDGIFGAITTYGDLVRRAVEKFPDRIAFGGDGEGVTYRALGGSISRMIRVLKAKGLVRGDGVAILSTNRPEYFAVTAACALLGVRFTPLHPLGSLDDHVSILEDARINVLVFEPGAFQDRADDMAAKLPTAITLISLGPSPSGIDLLALSDAYEPGQLANEARPTDVLAIAYTGGTTGTPKGVVLSHRAIVEQIRLCLVHWQWPASVRILLTTPISHAAGALIVPTLLRGGTVFLRPRFRADALSLDIDRFGITTLFLIPTMIYMLLDALRHSPHRFPSLELILYGAAPMSPARLKEGLARFGPIFFQLYGQVESSVALTALRKEDHLDERRLMSCGRPLVPENLRITTPDGAEAEIGSVGEIAVTGPTLMDGYWRRDVETADAMRAGWLRTGDLAVRDSDGFITIVDRAKDLIVTGGFNVFPREVEEVLMGHPDVKLACVIGVPHEKWGEAIHGLVVPAEGRHPNAEELIALVRARKGVHQAPKAIAFVEDLPLTPIGKIDKKAVRARFWQGRERHVG